MNSKLVMCGLLLMAAATTAFAANARNWQQGTLTETEQSKVKEGSTKNSNTDGTAKNRGNKTDYSQNTTTTTTDNYETYQTYTIQGEHKTYVPGRAQDLRRPGAPSVSLVEARERDRGRIRKIRGREE